MKKGGIKSRGANRLPGSIDAITSIRGPAMAGLGVIALLLGGFSAWAFSAPLSGAIIATGKIVTDSNAQIVRHERGGVLAALLVREGSHVQEGDIVATLQRAQEQSALQELRARIAGLAARQQRLTAEQLDRNDLAISIDTLPKSVEGLEATLIDYLINDQMTEFRDRRTQLSDTLGVLLAQRRAFEEQMLGSQGQLDALNGQLSSLATDVELRRTAIKDGFGRESALREMERQEGSARGEIAKMNSTLAALRHQIEEIDQRIGSTRSQFKEKVSNELSKTRSELIEAIETLAGKAETAARVDIRAPVTGVVKTLHVNTIGSAVEPYRPLLEIVPEGRPLLIEAHIQPTDVDNVFPQQKAKVVLSAFNRHLFDPADAHVEFVAADATKDEATGQSYFVVRLAVDATNDKPLPPIVPGMPAEAYLVTGDRTFAEYIAEPFVQSFQRAFRQ